MGRRKKFQCRRLLFFSIGRICGSRDSFTATGPGVRVNLILRDSDMIVDGKQIRPIWLDDGSKVTVKVIDQRQLPHQFVVADLNTRGCQVIHAIREMLVRGAPADRRYRCLWCDAGGHQRESRRPTMVRDSSGRPADGSRPPGPRPSTWTGGWIGYLKSRDAPPVHRGGWYRRRPHRGRRYRRGGGGELPPDRCAWRRTDRRQSAVRKNGGNGQPSDPLQCRLAGLHRIRNGHRAHL
jgi:hypothetical protein